MLIGRINRGFPMGSMIDQKSEPTRDDRCFNFSKARVELRYLMLLLKKNEYKVRKLKVPHMLLILIQITK